MTRFAGMPYPVCGHARGLLRTQEGVNQIKSDLLSLILTNQGERVMLPGYGVSLRQFLFEPNDAVVADEIRAQLDRQLRLWEPRVVIEQIEIKIPSKDELDSNDDLTERGSVLLIRILFFDPENIQEIQDLKLEVHLPGG